MTLWEGRISTGMADAVADVHRQPALRPGAGRRRPGRLARPREGARQGGHPHRQRGGRPPRRARHGRGGVRDGRLRLRARATRTSTPPSSGASPSWSATSAPSCTPGGAATTRWPPTCACGAGARSSAWPTRSWRCRTRWPSGPARPADVYLPGYTHLQRAQPVLLAHHLLAHGWALARDVDRLLTTVDRLNISPLGAGALAGSSLPLDPDYVAAELGFHGRFENSLDAVSDRDFVAEALFDLALLGVHLSRMGEEIVLWSTEEFGFCTLDDAYATGQLDAAAEEEPRRGRAGPGQVGPADRPPQRGARHPQGPAAGLQPRPAGGQGAALRRRGCRSRGR